MSTVSALIKNCPVCGRAPDIDECGPSVVGVDLGWYANCYRMAPFEHCIGVNADTKRDAVRLWNAEVDRIAATQTHVAKDR